ncbi:MAG: hypothetical protein Q9192_008168 [Flavoplaca navasiana]
MLRIEGLSAEILTRIVENFPVSDQMSFRLVSKRFNHVISPRVFRDITVYTDRSSASHHPFPSSICPFITCLTIEVVDYQELDEAEWRDEVEDRWTGYNMSHNPVYHSRRHNTQAWAVYERCRRDLQINTIRSMTLLSSHLKSMLQLRQLSITDAEGEVRTEDYSNGRCNILNCPHQNYDHTVLAVPLIPGLQSLGMTVMSLVMRGLPDMVGRLPSLVISSPTASDFMHSGFHYNALVTPPAPLMLRSSLFVSVVSSLTRLTLQLLYDDCLERQFFAKHGESHVSQMLSRATNLVQLKIEMRRDYGNQFGSLADFRAILHGCAFHRLRSLSISGFKSTEGELVAFTDGSPNLDTIEVESFTLIHGSWVAILDHWSMQLLKHLYLTDLCERSASRRNKVRRLCSRNGPAYSDLPDRLQKFLVTGVSNPFRS